VRRGRIALAVAVQTEFLVVVLQEPQTLHRGCHGAGRAALEAALTSNYQAGRTPHPADLRATALHMSVSMFEDPEVIARLVERRPDRVGTHVARVDLQPGHGVCVADTGGPGHWSVWGIPARLAECVVDVTQVLP
jgi:hypothetical protein